jgi:hypothetical protein
MKFRMIVPFDARWHLMFFRPFVLRAGSAGFSPPLLLGGRFPFVTEDFRFFRNC